MLYEFEGANEAIYNLKYMLVERDSNLSNTYKYTFLDKGFNFLSGYVELRRPSFLAIEKMLVLDVGPNGGQVVQEVGFDQVEMPFEMEKNMAMEFSVDWQSKSQDNRKYHLESSRKLIEIGSGLDLFGSQIKTIILQTNDKIEILDRHSVNKTGTESLMISEYGKGIGLIGMEIKFANGLGSKAKLKAIHRSAEIEGIKWRIKNKEKAQI